MAGSIPTSGKSSGGAKFAEVQYVNIDDAGGGNVELVAAVAGKIHRVVGLVLFAAAAGDVYFNDGTANLFGGTAKVPLSLDGTDGGPSIILPPCEIGYFETGAANRPLNLNAGADVAGVLQYVSIDA